MQFIVADGRMGQLMKQDCWRVAHIIHILGLVEPLLCIVLGLSATIPQWSMATYQVALWSSLSHCKTLYQRLILFYFSLPIMRFPGDKRPGWVELFYTPCVENTSSGCYDFWARLEFSSFCSYNERPNFMASLWDVCQPSKLGMV